MLFCHITTRIEDQKYSKLLGQKGGRGFPHIVAMDASGNVLAKHKGPRNADGFKSTMEQGAETKVELATLKKKAKKDKNAAMVLFEKRLGLGHLTAAQARKHAKTLDIDSLDADRAKEIKGLLAGMEFGEIMAGVTRDKKTQVAAGKKCAAMIKAGRIPSDRSASMNFWYFTSIYAEKAKDADLYGKAVAFFKDAKGIRPQFVKQLEATLEKLKKGGGTSK